MQWILCGYTVIESPSSNQIPGVTHDKGHMCYSDKACNQFMNGKASHTFFMANTYFLSFLNFLFSLLLLLWVFKSRSKCNRLFDMFLKCVLRFRTYFLTGNGKNLLSSYQDLNMFAQYWLAIPEW